MPVSVDSGLGVRTTPRLLWLSALVILGALSATLTVFVTTSRAAPCPDTNLNTVARPDTNGRGNRVANPGMYVYNTSISCGRVSSIFDLNSSDTRWVEVGWFEDPGGVYNCLPSTSGSPEELAFAYKDGVSSCLTNPGTLTGGQADAFKIEDGDQDGVWNFYHDAAGIFSRDMGTFVTGHLASNGERLNTDDPAKADFNGLGRMNGPSSWVAWDNTHEDTGYSDDPGYKYCEYSNTHTAVKANSDTC